MIEATFQELVERMERLADESCPKCKRVVGVHTPSELVAHGMATWDYIWATFEDVFESVTT